MTKNVGNIDKIIRIVIGLLIGALGIIYQSWWGLIAIVPILTAFLNYCPLYCPLKISTKEKK